MAFNPNFLGKSSNHQGARYPVGVYQNPENGQRLAVFSSAQLKSPVESIQAAALAAKGWEFHRDFNTDEISQGTYKPELDDVADTMQEEADLATRIALADAQNVELKARLKEVEARLKSQTSAGSRQDPANTAKRKAAKAGAKKTSKAPVKTGGTK